MPIVSPPSDMPQDVIDFRTRTVMPEAYVDELWAKRPGYLTATIKGAYAEIYSQLRKRYTVPFPDATRPESVVRWMTRIATSEVYRARGVDSNDEQIPVIDKDRDDARAELQLAANSETGLYDLPLDDTKDPSAVTKGGPLGYSEASPYTWTDVQADQLYGGYDRGRWPR